MARASESQRRAEDSNSLSCLARPLLRFYLNSSNRGFLALTMPVNRSRGSQLNLCECRKDAYSGLALGTYLSIQSQASFTRKPQYDPVISTIKSETSVERCSPRTE